jgi:hypothetical protein
LAGKKRGGLKSKPTGKRRAEEQQVKDRYAHARDDAQRLGLIQTTPEEALVPERVDPATQQVEDTSALDRRAINQGWRVPDPVKTKVIERLAEPFFSDRIIINGKGEEVRVPHDPKLLTENARVLLKADQHQYERDHPDLAGKAKGGGNQQLNVNVGAGGNAVTDELALMIDRMKSQRAEEQAIAAEEEQIRAEEERIKSHTHGTSDTPAESRNGRGH